MWKITKRFASLGPSFYSNLGPVPLVHNPRLVHLNHELIAKLGLREIKQEEWLKLLNGTALIEGYQPLASVYMGHQFGVAVPQLGDGRALMIAEHIDPTGQVWELQLKGSGPTPYSRHGDGRAVLRSSLREYLASAAMAALGIATTQAVALLMAQDPVYREEIEPAAVILRAAPSLLRFGHFEYFANHGKVSELNQLLEFCIAHYFPEIELQDPQHGLKFLAKVLAQTAKLMAQWQAVGFVHGVMNSDNMSILGLTIDYGPYAFIDSFNPQQIFNHSDSEGRYTYANQPQIAWWNLYRLGESLIRLGYGQAEVEQVLAQYPQDYNQAYTTAMGHKLGISNFTQADLPLLDELLEILYKHKVDWTFFWRQLSHHEAGRQVIATKFPAANLSSWYAKLEQRYLQDPQAIDARQQAMLQVNPAIVARNHLLQRAIELAQQGDFSEVNRLFTALSDPYTEHPEFADYYTPAPNWSEHIVLSCSS